MTQRPFVARLAMSILRGVALGAAAGALAGAYDVLRSLLLPEGAVAEHHHLATVLWTAGPTAVIGAVAGLFLVAAPRWLLPVIAAGTVWFCTAMTANVYFLPGFLAPVSIGVNGALLAVAVLALFLLRKRFSRIPGVLVPGLLLGLSALLGFGLDLILTPAPPSALRATRPDHPSILLLTVDSLRRDHTSLHGYERETTPNLTRFAEDAMVYERAWSPSAWTLPSTASILTGLPPGIHTAESSKVRLPDRALTIAEVLSASGYDTGMFTWNAYVSSNFGLAQGFDLSSDAMIGRAMARLGIPRGTFVGRVTWELLEKRLGLTIQSSPLGRVIDEFAWWLDSRTTADRPWFAYLHTMDVHWPYGVGRRMKEPFGPIPPGHPDIPDREKGMGKLRPGEPVEDDVRQSFVNLYDASIRMWDTRFAGLLEILASRGRDKNLIIAVISDHGESFYEHELWFHGTGLYEHQTRVPVLIRTPDHKTGRCERNVSLLGLPGALLTLAGFEPPETMDQPETRLYPFPEEDRPILVRLLKGRAFQVSVLEGGEKWIFGKEDDAEFTQCFSLDRDPTERQDLAPGRPGDAARMREWFLKRARQEQKMALSATSADGDRRVDDALKGLGYLR